MTVAGVENISSCTNYKTSSSLRVSVMTTAPSRLTVEACGLGENGLCGQAAWGSGPTAFCLSNSVHKTERDQYLAGGAVMRVSKFMHVTP